MYRDLHLMIIRSAACCPPCTLSAIEQSHHKKSWFWMLTALYNAASLYTEGVMNMLQVQRMRVDVEIASPLTAGQTVCDVWGHSRLPVNAAVARSVDVAGFWALMHEALAASDAASPCNAAGAVATLTAADL